MVKDMRFVPWSGIAFIFLSVLFIAVWTKFKDNLDDSFFLLLILEGVLFLVCYLGERLESSRG